MYPVCVPSPSPFGLFLTALSPHYRWFQQRFNTTRQSVLQKHCGAFGDLPSLPRIVNPLSALRRAEGKGWEEEGGHARYSASFGAHAQPISARGAQRNRAFAGGDEKRALISRTLLEELFRKLSKRRELAVAGSVSRLLRVDTQDLILAHLASVSLASSEILHGEKFPINRDILLMFFSPPICAIDLRQGKIYMHGSPGNYFTEV